MQNFLSKLKLKNYSNLQFVSKQKEYGGDVLVLNATYTLNGYSEQRTIFVKNSKVISWYS